MPKQHTTSARVHVTVSDLELTVTPKEDGPTFRIDTLTVVFKQDLVGDPRIRSQVEAYGYRLDENGDKAGSYRQVKFTHGERPDAVQEVVEAQRTRLTESFLVAFNGNDVGLPVESEAQAEEKEEMNSYYD